MDAREQKVLRLPPKPASSATVIDGLYRRKVELARIAEITTSLGRTTLPARVRTTKHDKLSASIFGRLSSRSNVSTRTTETWKRLLKQSH